MNRSGAPQSVPSLDLDLLPEEFFPVDDFFNSYVNELSHRSKRQGEPGLLSAPEAKHLRVAQPSSLPLSMPATAAGGLGGLPEVLPGGLPLHQHHQQQQTLNFSQQQRQQLLPQTAAMLDGLSLPLQGMCPPMDSPVQPGGLAPGGAVPAGAAQLAPELLSQGGAPFAAGAVAPAAYAAYPGAAGMGGPLPTPSHMLVGGLGGGDVLGYGAAPMPIPSGGEGDSGGGYSDDFGGGADSKGKKSAKQQVANKVAQQRYRERKKAKFNEMEATIEQLTRQLHQLQALQSRNAILEGQNTDLEGKLVEREQEIERLKVVLDRQADEGLPEGGEGEGAGAGEPRCGGGAVPQGEECGGAAAGKDGGVSTSGDNAVPCCDVLPKDLSGIDFKRGFSDQVAKLKELVEEHRLREVDPSGESLPPPLQQHLAREVGRSCQLCQAALRVEGVKVIDLISTDPASLSQAGDEAENQRWRSALQVMNLRPGQQQQLLMLRQSHLAKMRGIYEERQRLNLEAMALMLPHQSRNPSEDNTVEGRLHNISNSGYLAIARSNAELGAVLDKVKDNLRREQRAVMDINCVTISKILSPIQSALYMVEMYPQHCDALALTNVLARVVGKEELGIPPGRCPNAATCPKVAAGICNGHNCLTLGIDSSVCKGGNQAGGGLGAGDVSGGW